jgi:hypothetical protein
MPTRAAAARILAPALLASVAGSTTALAASPFPPVLDLASLDGDSGFVVQGDFDSTGRSVASAGDVNGDGIDDIIIGAPDAGFAYVVFGRDTDVAGPFAPTLDPATLDGTNGFTIDGPQNSDRVGFSVDAAGDVNGDGFDDLIVGTYSPYVGKAHVVFGAPSVGAGGTLSLPALNGTNGFVLNGVTIADGCGSTVSTAGDFNADGFDDIVVGALRAEADGQAYAGEAYVVFGGATVGSSGAINLAGLSGADGFALGGAAPFDFAAWSVAQAGDANGDGIDDLIIGAPYAAPAGAAYIVFGVDTAVEGPFPASMSLSTLDGTNGFAIPGIGAGDRFGYAVSTAGDANGDGIDDLIIGAPHADPSGFYSGESWVVFGKSSPFPASINLALLNGTDGFVVPGLSAYDECGSAVSAAGDINGDGIDDILIGAPRVDSYFGDSGATYVVFGAAGLGAPGSLDLSTLDGSDGFVLTGIEGGERSGRAVSGAGDVNSDGFDDLIIGAPGISLSTRGRAYIVFRTTPDPCLGDINSDGSTNAADFVIFAGNFGTAVPPNTIGDLNGDGIVNAFDFTILAGNFGCQE